MRCVFSRKQVESLITPESRALYAVLETRDGLPLARTVTQVMREVAAVAISHGGDDPLAILAAVQRDLGNPGELLADFIFVLADRRPKPMKPYLLVEIDILLRPLTGMRVTCVKEARTVRGPGGATASGGVLNARDNVRKFLTCVYLEEVERALLATAFG